MDFAGRTVGAVASAFFISCCHSGGLQVKCALPGLNRHRAVSLNSSVWKWKVTSCSSTSVGDCPGPVLRTHGTKYSQMLGTLPLSLSLVGY